MVNRRHSDASGSEPRGSWLDAGWSTKDWTIKGPGFCRHSGALKVGADCPIALPIVYCAGIWCPGTVHSGGVPMAFMVYLPPTGQAGNWEFLK
jgi:hypothetical protein